MNTSFLKNLRLLAIALVLVIGLSYAHASVWSGPSADAPGNNTETPLNTGAWQYKTGGLSVTTFAARANAQLDQTVSLLGMVRANNFAYSTVLFGDTATGYGVGIDASGSVNAQQQLIGNDLANTSSRKVCADFRGKLFLCAPQCSDGIDNDGDGHTDYPNDPGCTGPNDDDETNAPDPICAANLAFQGNFRWGRITYTGPAQHSALTVTATLYGREVPPSDPENEQRNVIFTIPQNSTDSYNAGANCTPNSGCEIEGTMGFEYGRVTSVTPTQLYQGGLVCF